MLGLAGQKQAVVLVPPGIQIRVRALYEGKLGPGRKPGEQRFDPELAIGGRCLLVAVKEHPPGTLHAERTDRAYVRH